MTRIALVAGEPSGDLLAARVVQGLQRQAPQASVMGIGGPALKQAGQEQWYDLDALSVFGYVDALKRLPTLWRIFQGTKRRCLRERPNVFVGIDAPDFNLRLETQLKAAGIPTVQFVSPSIWAWRYERIHRIRAAVSHMLVLFPFEVPLYEKEGIPVSYVGHPLAQEIPLEPDTQAARQTLGLADDAPILALLPGSRASEIKWLAPLFLQSAQRIKQAYPQIQFVIPAVNPARERELRQWLEQYPIEDVHVFSSQEAASQPISWTVMQAADAVLLASGTAALEGMMFKKPLVIAYILSPWMRRLMAWQSGQQKPYTPWVGLPNILANEEIAPEFLQEEATVPNLFKACEQALFDEAYRIRVQQKSLILHQQLSLDTAALAAQTILDYA